MIGSEPAKADLRSIHDFITHDSRHYAKKVTQDIREKTEVLDELPKLGNTVPEVRDEKVRELSLYSYRIIYDNSQKDIQILTVVHAKRNFDDAFGS